MSGSARPMNPERGDARATGKGRRPSVGASDSPPTPTAATKQEPCPVCGCPGEKYDGHVCGDYKNAETFLGRSGIPEPRTTDGCPWCVGWAEDQCDHAWGF